MAPKRVVIIANKWWEADPLCAVLINSNARPKSFDDFQSPSHPFLPDLKNHHSQLSAGGLGKPRLTFTVAGASVEVWCLQELMNPAVSSSSSLEKARVLVLVMSAGATPALVVAFGTAGTPSGVAANGCAVVGRRTFVHDPLKDQTNRDGCWNVPKPDEIIDSAFPLGVFSNPTSGCIDEQAKYAAEARFLRSPINSAEPPLAIVGNGQVSIGTVNVTNYDEYAWADGSALTAFEQVNGTQPYGSHGTPGSIETTHGIIRFSSEAPFLFVSGITDMEGLFDFQVTPRVYGQNYVAAHNAAITIAWLLPGIVSVL